MAAWFVTVPAVPVMLTPVPEPEPPPSVPRLEIVPELLVTLPPLASTTASTPEIEPVFVIVPLLASETPLPPEAAILPALLIVQLLTLLPPSTPSEEPLEVTVPLLVT